MYVHIMISMGKPITIWHDLKLFKLLMSPVNICYEMGKQQSVPILFLSLSEEVVKGCFKYQFSIKRRRISTPRFLKQSASLVVLFEF